jgi:phosphoglycolate phosphatase
MWSGWIERLAAALSAAAGQPLAAGYYAFVHYDPQTHRTLPGGRLARLPMATLQALTVQFLHGLGVAEPARVVAEAWFAPDPIRDAHPLADLAALFGALRGLGCRLAVATTDDHAPTVATLAHLEALSELAAVLAADDGVPLKPAPDMVLEVCRQVGVPPERTVMVGDSLDDLRMARAAGATAVGVLTGLTAADKLAPHADGLLANVARLPTLFQPEA